MGAWAPCDQSRRFRGRMQNSENPTPSLFCAAPHAAWSTARLEAGLILASLPCYNCSLCTNWDLSVRQRTHSSTALTALTAAKQE